MNSWQKLTTALRGISPAGYLRSGLVLAAAAGIIWVAWQARTALLPFFIGGAIAYILVPLVNTMDRVLPRFLAVVTALALLLGGLVLVFYLLIPPLVREAPVFLNLIPDRTEIQAAVERLRGFIQTLPPNAQATVVQLIEKVSVTLRQSLDNGLNNLAGNLIAHLVRVFNSIGFILGFLIVPAWLLTVLKDQRKGFLALNRVIPAPAQKDFWAMIKIVDRPLRAYVGGQFLLSLVVGVGVYALLSVLEMFGFAPVTYKVPLAVWAATFELIPEIGPYLGAVPAVLGGFLRSPQEGLIVIGTYIALHYLINQIVGSRVENRIIQGHPAILLVVLVAISQFGFLWVLLAAPIISIVSGLFRYLYGRLSDPPMPAGVLPGEPVPVAPTVQETPTYRIPRVYQRRAAARRSSERM